ncbi:MAG: hypothetical protein GMKNLPBB_00432 [Myxococcota bacterium]|nr:hypothetical protein [Myxococcota bacterium]
MNPRIQPRSSRRAGVLQRLTSLVLLLAAAVFAPGSANATFGEEDIFTFDKEVEPNVIIAFADGRYMTQWAYSWGPTDYNDRNCYNGTDCPGFCGKVYDRSANELTPNYNCPKAYYGPVEPGTTFSFSSANCTTSDSLMYHLNVEGGSYNNDIYIDSSASALYCRIYNRYGGIRDIYYRTYTGNEFNAAVATYQSVVADMLAKESSISGGEPENKGYLSSWVYGNEARVSLFKFNNTNADTNQPAVGAVPNPPAINPPQSRTSHDGVGACLAQDITTTPWTALYTGTNTVRDAFRPSASYENEPKWLSPIGEMLGEIHDYFRGRSSRYCYDLETSGVPTYSNPMGNRSITNPQDVSANDAYIVANNFTLLITAESSTADDDPDLLTEEGYLPDGSVVTNQGDQNADGRETIAFNYYGSDHADDMALLSWRRDFLDDSDAAYTSGLGYATQCSKVFIGTNKTANCRRQSMATDVFAAYANTAFTDNPDLLGETARWAQGTHYLFTSIGQNCDVNNGSGHNANPGGCWDYGSLARAMNNYFTRLAARNVDISRPFYLSRPTIDMDFADPDDDTRNKIIIPHFVPTPGSMYEGHLVAFRFGTNRTVNGGADNFDTESSGLERTLFQASGTLKSYSSADFLWDAGHRLYSSGYQTADNRVVYTHRRMSDSTLTVVNYDHTSLTASDMEVDVYGSGTTEDNMRLARTYSIVSRILNGVPSYWIGASVLASWKMADMSYSTPIVVGQPSPFFIDSGLVPGESNGSWASFFTGNKTRRKVVYAATNDGVLHAFDAGSHSGVKYDNGTGNELWAFVPNWQLRKFKHRVPAWESGDRFASWSYTGGAQFGSWLAGRSYSSWVPGRYTGIDATPHVNDAWIDADYDKEKDCPSPFNAATCEWKTILVGGMGMGGRAIYALDITDPTAPKVIGREFRYNNSTGTGDGAFNDTFDSVYESEVLGYTTSEPAIGRNMFCDITACSPEDATEFWYAIFGAGYHPSGDPSHTSCPSSPYKDYELPCYDTGTTTTVSRGILAVDLRTMKKLWEVIYDPSGSGANRNMKYSMASSMKLMDANGDGFTETGYIGDLGGNMWRVDMPLFGVKSGAGIVATCATTTSANCWGVRRVFDAETNSKVPGPTDLWYPVWNKVASTLSVAGTRVIAWGTGDRNDMFSTSNNKTGRLILMNDIRGEELNLADLSNRTTPASGENPVGWYMTFGGTNRNGEKILTSPTIFGFSLLWTTFIPDNDADLSTAQDLTKAEFTTRTTIGCSKMWQAHISSGNFMPTQMRVIETGGSDARESTACGRGMISSPIVRDFRTYAAAENPSMSNSRSRNKLVALSSTGELHTFLEPASISAGPLGGIAPPDFTRVIYWRPTNF